MRIIGTRLSVHGALAVGLLGLAVSPQAAEVRPGAPELAPVWAKLDSARNYRHDLYVRPPGIVKDYDTMIEDYWNPDLPCPNETPRCRLLEAADEFRNFASEPGLSYEATLGLQETLNEIMAGQLLLGNDFLIKGLRVRFPGSEPRDNSQTFYLEQSVLQFQTAIDQVVEDLRRDPESLRVGGDANAQFSFLVENSVLLGGGQGELVENELYRFTDVVDRSAVARNSLGKRLFFFGNVKDEDNFPYGNFPGPEDLDLDNDGIQNAHGRDLAAQMLKRSAQATYLHSAVLAAVQTPEQFDQNNGFELKREILDANRVFEDILAGFNPLQLLGDFVPFQPVENFLSLCSDAVTDAEIDENAAAGAAREYDQDQTALTEELGNQQVSFVDEIEALTGLASVDTSYDLLDPDERERLLTDAETSAAQGYGTLGAQVLAIEQAAIEARQAEEALRQIPEKIRIEESRNSQIARVVMANGYTFAALSYMDSLAGMFSVSCCGLSSGVSFNPGAGLQGELRAIRDILAAMQEATVSGINSAAAIKQYLLDGALAAIAVERAGNIIEQQQVRYNELLAQLQRTVQGYVTAQEDLADAYFANPAYRLARDLKITKAENSFATAMEECYVAAKALEYLWSERFNNPVARLDGLLPEYLPPSADTFYRAESVFSVKFARAGIPNLDDFRDALQEWDVKMRQLRAPSAQQSSRVISVRRNILGYNGVDEDLNRLLFRDFIAKHRVPGQNPSNPDLIFEFGVEIADQKLFPDYPNIKIAEMRVNLVSSPTRSIAGPGTTAEPAKVELVMLDEAVVRTFFAELPDDEDLITYDLQEGRSLSKSPFLASVDATIDGFSFPAPMPNGQLVDHSPAVTRWTLRMRMDQGNNENLLLEHLDDIQITFTYNFGKPRQVAFP